MINFNHGTHCQQTVFESYTHLLEMLLLKPTASAPPCLILSGGYSF